MKHSDVRAIILAAGMGYRSLPLSTSINKVLIPVNRYPLLWYSITNLLSVGVTKILIVTGYKSKSIIKFVKFFFPKEKIFFKYNNLYNRANNIVSYRMCCNFLKNSNYFRLDGDIIYSKNILVNLMRSKYAVTIATIRKQKFIGDELRIEVDKKKHTIKRFGKTIPLKTAYGETIGIEFVSQKASHKMWNILKSTAIEIYKDKLCEYSYELIAKKDNDLIHYMNLKKNNYFNELDTYEDFIKLSKCFKRKYARDY